jgi:hypothetical protein
MRNYNAQPSETVEKQLKKLVDGAPRAMSNRARMSNAAILRMLVSEQQLGA